MENPVKQYKYDYGFKTFGELPNSIAESPNKIRVLSWNTLAHKYKKDHDRNYTDKTGLEPAKRKPMLVATFLTPFIGLNHQGQQP